MAAMNDLASRLSESSGYPWQSNSNRVDPADSNKFLFLEIDLTNTEIPVALNFLLFVVPEDEILPIFPTYKDLESGLFIQYHLGNKACLRMIESTPKIEKVTD